MNERFFGVVPAMATPFRDDYSLDEARVRELLEWYLECGVHGISVAGEPAGGSPVEFDGGAKPVVAALLAAGRLLEGATPAGKIETRIEAASSVADTVPEIVRAGVVRTARLLLAGRVFVNVPNEALAA